MGLESPRSSRSLAGSPGSFTIAACSDSSNHKWEARVDRLRLAEPSAPTGSSRKDLPLGRLGAAPSDARKEARCRLPLLECLEKARSRATRHYRPSFLPGPRVA